MNPLLSHYFRIDARSLGIFRALFGLCLIGDLFARWDSIDAFYTNEAGLLPNHNHLFNLKQQGRFVWSALHAFSGDGEALFAFYLILFFYVCFTLGWKTRAFHLLAGVSLLSLVARNTLAEGPGDWLALAVVILTAFLPLGSAFSVDALTKRWREAREAGHEPLNDRSNLPDQEEVQALRRPGWSPTSIAAFGVLLQIALVFVALAVQQKGAWRDGSGLGTALGVHLFASPLGWSMRDSALIRPLGALLYWSQWAIPVLLVVPVARGPMRAAAATLMAVFGLAYGLFTNLGLFGWTIAACSVLVLANDTWRAWATRHDPGRVRTVIYDADCGVCFLLCQLLKRWDTRRHLVFQGNDLVNGAETYRDGERGKLLAWSEKRERVVEKALPSAITPELVEGSVVAVSPRADVAVRAAAVSDVLRAVPGFGVLGRILVLPGVEAVANWLYDAFAKRRTAVSTELGLAACGVPEEGSEASVRRPVASPARMVQNRITGSVREVLAGLFVVSVLLQTVSTNDLGPRSEHKGFFEGISWWTRTLADWRIMTPEPPDEHGGMVVDALTRGDQSVDPLTGRAPEMTLARPFELGAMWSNYLGRIHRDEYKGYVQAFRTYIAKVGPRWPTETNEAKIVGVDAYWVTGPVGSDAEPSSTRLFRHGRGGRTFAAPGPATPEASGNRAPALKGLLPTRPAEEGAPRPPPDKGPTDGSNQDPDTAPLPTPTAQPAPESLGQESR